MPNQSPRARGVHRLALITAALPALWALPAASQTVTLYGVVDVYAATIKAGKNRVNELNDGGNLASRIGFRGVEDLGGGMKAEFTLESSFFGDTGAAVAAAFWDRQVFVGLSGSAGRLRLGRQYSPHFIALATADPYGANAVFSPLGMIFARDGQPNLTPFPVRMNNMIGYMSPNMGGFTAEVAYAPGESATASTRSGDGLSMALSYRQGPLFVALSASQMRGGSAAAPVADPSTNNFVSIGGSYKFGSLTAYGNWVETSTNAAATNDVRHINLGLKYELSTATTLTAGYTMRDLANSSRDANVLVLGVDYALSVRTALYARALNLNNKGNASNGAARGLVAANSGDDIRGLAVGLRHSF